MPCGRDAQRLGRLFPLLVGADGLARRLRRELEVEVVEAVVAQQVEHEVERRRQLAGHLLLGAEDVRVVLGHAAHARETVHHARLLVAVHRAELEHPHRQLAVRARAVLEDQDVERAVHRLEVVGGALARPPSSRCIGGNMPSANQSRWPDVSNSPDLVMCGVFTNS